MDSGLSQGELLRQILPTKDLMVYRSDEMSLIKRDTKMCPIVHFSAIVISNFLIAIIIFISFITVIKIYKGNIIP